MRRAYIIAGILMGAGVIVAVVTLLSNPINIPDAAAGSLGIEGRLLLAGQDGVSIFDLSTGKSRTVFTPGPRGIVAAAALSPDGSTLAMAYAPPPEGLIQFGFTNLYTLPPDGTEQPEMLVDGGGREAISTPAWSPDGKSVLYVRAGTSADGLATQLTIERVAASGGDPQLVVRNGIAPGLSADGAKLAYVAVAADTAVDTLTVAGADGGGPVVLAGSDRFVSIDRPHFSPDGQWIVFSGNAAPFSPGNQSGRAPGIDWVGMLGGVRTARAHDIPTADIWRIPTAGGAPSRLIQLLAAGVVADYSPDGAHIAFITTQGLYVMNSDGSHPARVDQGHVFTSVEWLGDGSAR